MECPIFSVCVRVTIPPETAREAVRELERALAPYAGPEMREKMLAALENLQNLKAEYVVQNTVAFPEDLKLWIMWGVGAITVLVCLVAISFFKQWQLWGIVKKAVSRTYLRLARRRRPRRRRSHDVNY